MKWPLKNLAPNIPEEGSLGDFASKRSFYFHSGIDLYCSKGQEVIAIEDGIVISFDCFTGPNSKPPSPWWNETFSVMVEGESGVIAYCELLIADPLDIGDRIKAGDSIGHIVPVLKKDKGNGTAMLHLEQYVPGVMESVTWVLGTPQPPELINPRNLLNKVINEK